jgi:hypothetical protein
MCCRLVRHSGVIEASGKFSLRALIRLCERSPPPPFWASDHAGVVATLRIH